MKSRPRWPSVAERKKSSIKKRWEKKADKIKRKDGEEWVTDTHTQRAKRCLG